MCISELVWWQGKLALTFYQRGSTAQIKSKVDKASLSSSHIQWYEQIDLDWALLTEICSEVYSLQVFLDILIPLFSLCQSQQWVFPLVTKTPAGI